MKTSMKSLFIVGGLSQIIAIVTADESCVMWPKGWPKEHHDTSCNLEAQNLQLKAEMNNNPLPVSYYLNIPEEKTWLCPLEDDTADSTNQNSLIIGRSAKWILYNHASTPIVVSLVNESPLDIVSIDSFQSSTKQMKSAVYPNGPVVLPGDMAVVHGYEGQLFAAREYKEDYSLLFSMNDDEHVNSFKNALPRTWSFHEVKTRFWNGKEDVMHVLGTQGRVLMKHRMGLIYIKNEFGASCPEAFGGTSNGNNNRTAPFDPNPDCNFLRKGFINKAGCPIDLYFAPPKSDPESSSNCEVYSDHMGPLDEFINSGQTNVDSFDSPVINQRTYTSHSFVMRMSHDKSLVAKIGIDHDIVHDCPERRRDTVDLKINTEEMLMQSIPKMIPSNATTRLQERALELMAEQSNATISKIGSYTSLTYNSTSKIISSGVISGFIQYA